MVIEYLWKLNLWQQDPYNYDTVFIRVSYLIFYFSSFLLELKFSLSCISSNSISQMICGVRLDHHTKRYFYLLIRTIWKMGRKIFWQKCQRLLAHPLFFQLFLGIFDVTHSTLFTLYLIDNHCSSIFSIINTLTIKFRCIVAIASSGIKVLRLDYFQQIF